MAQHQQQGRRRFTLALAAIVFRSHAIMPSMASGKSHSVAERPQDRRVPQWVVGHERRHGYRRCATVREMKEDSSGLAIRC